MKQRGDKSLDNTAMAHSLAFAPPLTFTSSHVHSQDVSNLDDVNTRACARDKSFTLSPSTREWRLQHAAITSFASRI